MWRSSDSCGDTAMSDATSGKGPYQSPTVCGVVPSDTTASASNSTSHSGFSKRETCMMVSTGRLFTVLSSRAGACDSAQTRQVGSWPVAPFRDCWTGGHGTDP